MASRSISLSNTATTARDFRPRHTITAGNALHIQPGPPPCRIRQRRTYATGSSSSGVAFTVASCGEACGSYDPISFLVMCKKSSISFILRGQTMVGCFTLTIPVHLHILICGRFYAPQILKGMIDLEKRATRCRWHGLPIGVPPRDGFWREAMPEFGL